MQHGAKIIRWSTGYVTGRQSTDIYLVGNTFLFGMNKTQLVC